MYLNVFYTVDQTSEYEEEFLRRQRNKESLIYKIPIQPFQQLFYLYDTIRQINDMVTVFLSLR